MLLGRELVELITTQAKIKAANTQVKLKYIYQFSLKEQFKKILFIFILLSEVKAFPKFSI